MPAHPTGWYVEDLVKNNLQLTAKTGMRLPRWTHTLASVNRFVESAFASFYNLLN
jgi:hypothetical protein